MEKYPLQEESNDECRNPDETVMGLGRVAIAGYMAGGASRRLRWWQKLAAFLKRILKHS